MKTALYILAATLIAGPTHLFAQAPEVAVPQATLDLAQCHSSEVSDAETSELGAAL